MAPAEGTLFVIRMIPLALAGILLLGPTAARADILLSPFAGLSFVDGGSKGTYGVSLGIGSLITIEGDIARTNLGAVTTPGFDLDVTSTSYMGTIMVRPPFGSVQPYGLAGVGLIRLAGRFDLPFEGALGDATKSKLGYTIGGGLMLFFSQNLGLRGDVRYIRPFGDLTVGDLVAIPTTGDVPAGQLDVTRATIGLTLKF